MAKITFLVIPLLYGSLCMGKTIRIAVLDTGFDRNLSSAKLCDDAPYSPDKSYSKHGTIVADLIAKNAKDSDYCLYPMRIFKPNGKLDFIEYSYALAQLVMIDVDVVNLSIEGTTYSKAEATVMRIVINDGTIVFAAAGNHKKYLGKYSCKVYPACDDPRIVVVGTYDSNSGYGPKVSIKTNRNAGCVKQYCLSGTSQATAIETGRFVHYLNVH